MRPPPLLVYRADKLDDLSLHVAGRDYVAMLETWRAASDPADDPSRYLVEAWG